MSDDLREVERTYELVDPITERVYQRACNAIDEDPEDLRLDPNEAAQKVDADLDQMQRFCEIVVPDFDLQLSELPAPQGRTLFTTFLTAFWRESSGPIAMQSAVLNACGAAPGLPIFELTDPESR